LRLFPKLSGFFIDTILGEGITGESSGEGFVQGDELISVHRAYRERYGGVRVQRGEFSPPFGHQDTANGGSHG
jgi:hypothetical protein